MSTTSVRNRSSKAVWVVETDSGPAIAHILNPGKISPSGVDTDGVKGVNSSINGYNSWWKLPDLTGLTTIYDNGRGGLTIACNACFKVPEDKFGNIQYRDDPNWGIDIE